MSMDLTARLKLDDQFSSPLSRINSSMSRLQSATERSSGGMKRFTSSFAGLAGAIGVTAALAGSMMLVKNSIGSAFDRIDTMERFERSMKIMLGTSEKAKAALEGLSAVVDGTAYGLDTAARSTQNFVSRGIEVKKATKWFEAMGDAVAFYGDGSNEQLEGVSSAMSKMLSSGKVSMQQMETLYIAGIDGPGIYAKAVGKNTADVQKSLSKGKISAEEFFDVVTTAMLEGTNGVQKIAGTAKEAGATWAGAIANMKFAVVRGVTSIIQSIDELLANNGLPSLRDMVSKFGKKFESVLKGAAAAIQPFIDKAKSIYQTLKPYASIFKEVAIGVGIFVGAMFAVSATLSIISGLAGVLAFLSGPVGIAVLAITGLALAFRAFYEKSEPFKKAIDGVVGAVKGLFQLFTGNGVDAFSTFLDAGLDMKQIGKLQRFKADVSNAVDGIKEAFMQLTTMKPVDVLKALGMSNGGIAGITENIKSIKSAFSGFGDGFMEVVVAARPAVESLIESFANIGQTVMTFFENIQPGIASLIETFTSFGSTLKEVFTSIWSVLEPVFAGLGTAFSILGELATMVFNNIIVPSVNYAIQMFQLLWTVVGPILDLLGAAIELAFGVLKIVWDTILSPFLAFLTGAFKAGLELATPVIDAVGVAFDKVGSFVSGLAGMVRDFADALKNVKIPDWVSTLGGKLGGLAKSVGNVFSGGGGKVAIPGNFHGLDRVPYDGYLTKLHRGEKILTRQESDAYEGMDYTTASAGVSNDNRTYNYQTTTAATSDSGNGKAAGPVNLTVNYQGGQKLDEAEMNRFADFFAKNLIIAVEGGA